jgi:hypothetical protein
MAKKPKQSPTAAKESLRKAFVARLGRSLAPLGGVNCRSKIDSVGALPHGRRPTIWSILQSMGEVILGSRRSARSREFEVLLDKLVAIQMDLEPACGASRVQVSEAASERSIAEVCEVLRSAIADVRATIYQIDALDDLAHRDKGATLTDRAIVEGGLLRLVDMVAGAPPLRAAYRTRGSPVDVESAHR